MPRSPNQAQPGLLKALTKVERLCDDMIAGKITPTAFRNEIEIPLNYLLTVDQIARVYEAKS